MGMVLVVIETWLIGMLVALLLTAWSMSAAFAVKFFKEKEYLRSGMAVYIFFTFSFYIVYRLSNIF